jgi:steroid 5-alpha reductase family enzyme
MSDDQLITNHSGRTGQRNGVALGEGQIRRIFPVFVLVMWVTAGVWVGQGRWSTSATVLAVEALVVCLVVFVNFVWVFNIGYAVSTLLLNLTVLLVVGRPSAALVVGGVLALYGLRLLAFSLGRLRHPGFAERRAGALAAHASLPFVVKVVVWLQTATLFTFHAMTTYALARGDVSLTPLVAVGAALMMVGLVVEAVADRQKQRAKLAAPHRWVSTGVFRRTRHPNYAAEIAVQAGLLVCAVGAAAATGEWGWGVVGLVLAPTYIVLLMLSATTGAELATRARYGDDPEFQAYAAGSGALTPRRS